MMRLTSRSFLFFYTHHKMSKTDGNDGQASSGTQNNSDGNDGSSSQTQEGQLTQAQVDAKIEEAKASAVEAYKANNGRTEKQIREEAIAAYEASNKAKDLEKQGKFEELYNSSISEKSDLETKLAEAISKNEPLEEFKKKLSDTTATENESILSELEKNIPEEKKEQFEKMKSTLHEDPFSRKEQLVTWKFLLGDVTKGKNSPKTPKGESDEKAFDEALKDIKETKENSWEKKL